MDEFERTLNAIDRELATLYIADPEACIEKTYDFSRRAPFHKGLQDIVKKWRRRYVDGEIVKKKPLFVSEKFPVIFEFLKRLSTVEPSYKRTKLLLDAYQKKYVARTRLEQKEFIFRALEQLDMLLKLKKYEKAVVVADEILKVDPYHRGARRLRARAQKNFDRLVREEVISQIIASSARTVRVPS